MKTLRRTNLWGGLAAEVLSSRCASSRVEIIASSFCSSFGLMTLPLPTVDCCLWWSRRLVEGSTGSSQSDEDIVFRDAFWPRSLPRFLHNNNLLSHCLKITIISGQRTLTRGRIAVLSPIAEANRFVRPWPPSDLDLLTSISVIHASFCLHESAPNGIAIGSAVVAYTAAKASNAF